MPRRSAQDDPASQVEETIDLLYSLSPDEFTNERNEAAKRFRANGDQAGSDRVKALRRPTVAAWAVNLLPRRRPDLVDELLEAGAALRAAQRAALSGSRKVDLRAVTQRRREAVAALLDEAERVLGEAGREAATHTDAIRSTLEAASVDEATGDLLRKGRLTKEVEPPSGLGDVTPFEILLGGASGGESPGDQSPAAQRLRERTELRVKKAEDALAAAQDAATQARQEAEAAANEVDRLERELRTAQRRAERASKAAASAAAREDKAKQAVSQAEAEADF